MIDVCLLGTGGMMPLPGRALTALYVRCGGRALLIDCGEGTQTAIRSAAMRFKSIEALLITHFHADHISGLPGLLLTLGNEGRTEPLAIFGPEGLTRIVNSLRAIVPDLPFALEFHEFSSRECARFSCAGFTVDAFPADHGMPCFGYRLQLDRQGKFDPQKARAKGIPVALWSRLQSGECIGGFTPDDVLGPSRKGLNLLYSTDTRPTPTIEEYAQNADLLILEGMFGEADKQERAEVSHHMMMQEAAGIARRAHARELWLTHFSPANMTPHDFEEELRAIFPNTHIGSDGLFKTLAFDE